ncbi:MAG: SDR family oxidoreductase [Pseudomonadota bacterium]|nr:SDR family oxidoreductase [Pseudomonadota bacterium]
MMSRFYVFIVLCCCLSPVWADEEPTVLITGANRGIGLEIARIYADRNWNVIATARKPEAAKDLEIIQTDHPKLRIVQLDVTDHIRIEELAMELSNQPIDILINNAAISGGHENAKFGEMNFDVYSQVHLVNVVGPTKMAEAFLPNIKLSTQKKIINITSGQGSIEKTWGCCTFYRSSKAALNMMMKNISIELKKKGITVGLISPGFVKTGFTPGLDLPMMITAYESASKVIAVIDDYGLDDTGTFLGKDGQTWPW